METIRMLAARSTTDAIELAVQGEDGVRRDLRMSMTDFILLRLQLDQQQRAETPPTVATSHQPLSVVHPRQVAVQQEFGSGDPLLIFDLLGLGQLPIQMPRKVLGAIALQVAQWPSPDAAPPTGAN